MKYGCKEASKLASDGLDRKLTLWEQLKLQFHMLMCGKCKNCSKSMKIIRNTSKLISQSHNGKIRLTDEQRASLHKVLDENRNC